MGSGHSKSQPKPGTSNAQTKEEGDQSHKYSKSSRWKYGMMAPDPLRGNDRYIAGRRHEGRDLKRELGDVGPPTHGFGGGDGGGDGGDGG
ncbi:hypothetical protein M011DRAFT_465085, partial [Sporormia fimetaria CBS 119925]